MNIPANSSFVEVEGKNLYYQFISPHRMEEGSPIIIFLHEGLGSVAQWKSFPQQLCDQLNIAGLVYDRYGYGNSDALSEQHTKSYLHREAEVFLPGLLKQLNINNPLFLYGHSDGASIALLYAATKPQQLKKLISVAAHVIIEDISVEGISQAEQSFKTGKLKTLLERFHQEKTESMFYGWAGTWLNPDFKDWEILEELSKIECQVLAIQGDQDQYGSRKQLELIEKHCKGEVRSIFLDNCGHQPHFEKREEILEISTTFLL